MEFSGYVAQLKMNSTARNKYLAKVSGGNQKIDGNHVEASASAPVVIPIASVVSEK